MDSRSSYLTCPAPATVPAGRFERGRRFVGLWRDFPPLLLQDTGRRLIAFSRYGHGARHRLHGPGPQRFFTTRRLWCSPS